MPRSSLHPPPPNWPAAAHQTGPCVHSSPSLHWSQRSRRRKRERSHDAGAGLGRTFTLMGTAVRLEPLGLQHADDLFAAAQDPDIWRYLPADPSAAPAALRAWITAALDAQTAGGELPFAIRDRATGRALGSTRYLNISARDRGLEIGWTWLARPPAAPPSTPSASTCCCAMPSRPCAPSASSSRPTAATPSRRRPSNDSAPCVRASSASTCSLPTATSVTPSCTA